MGGLIEKRRQILNHNNRPLQDVSTQPVRAPPRGSAVHYVRSRKRCLGGPVRVKGQVQKRLGQRRRGCPPCHPYRSRGQGRRQDRPGSPFEGLPVSVSAPPGRRHQQASARHTPCCLSSNQTEAQPRCHQEWLQPCPPSAFQPTHTLAYSSLCSPCTRLRIQAYFQLCPPCPPCKCIQSKFSSGPCPWSRLRPQRTHQPFPPSAFNQIKAWPAHCLFPPLT